MVEAWLTPHRRRWGENRRHAGRMGGGVPPPHIRKATCYVERFSDHTESEASVTRQIRLGAVAVALLVLASGCAGDSPVEVANGGAAESDSLPGEFGAAGDDYEFVVATADHLVGLNDSSNDEKDGSGEVVDLETGQSTPLDAPRSEQTFLIQHIVASQDRVLVAGVDCGESERENDPDNCAARARALLLDPASGEWADVPLPSQATRSLSLLLDGSGSFVAAFRNSDEPDRALVLRMSDAEWGESSSIPDAGRSRWCMSGDTLYQLEIKDSGESAPPAEGYLPEALVTFTLRAQGPRGSSSELPTPDLYPFFGGEGVLLVCSSAGPMLVTSTGQASVPVLYSMSSGETWDEAQPGPSAESPALVTAGLSRANGTALITWEGVAGPDGDTSQIGAVHLTAIKDAASPRAIEGDFGDARFIPIGASDDTLAIGPLHSADPGDPDGAVANDPVTVQRIEGNS